MKASAVYRSGRSGHGELCTKVGADRRRQVEKKFRLLHSDFGQLGTRMANSWLVASIRVELDHHLGDGLRKII
jgi:hypothetical protein